MLTSSDFAIFGKHGAKGTRVARTVLKAFAVLAFATAVNFALCFALVPYGTKSEIMWTDYRQTDDIDTVVMGSSLLQRGCDPQALDSSLGVHAFNMSTPGQQPEESLLGLKKAIAEHDIHTVVYGVGISEMQDASYLHPGRAYILYKDAGYPAAYAHDAATCLSNPGCFKGRDSLNWAFPWIYNHVDVNAQVISTVKRNVGMRLDGTSVYDAAQLNEPGWTYYGRGYGSYSKCFDFDRGEADLYMDRFGTNRLDANKLRVLQQMAQLCAENNVDFIVIHPPMPAFNVLGAGDLYFEYSQEIAQMVESSGGTYYDFNMAKPDLFAIDHAYFSDREHLNRRGAQVFTESLSKLIAMRQAGEDATGLFYSREQWEDSIDSIDLVKLAVHADGVEISAAADALAGKNVVSEYQFCIQYPGSDAWDVVQDWSPQATCSFSGDSEQASAEVRVNVRPVGADVEYQRYRIEPVSYGM